MEIFARGRWAPFPDDDITSKDFDICVDTLRSLIQRTSIQDLHSNIFLERRRSIYETADPIFDIVKSIGRPVELPIVDEKSHMKVGRADAGFILFTPELPDFSFDGRNVYQISYLCTVGTLMINLIGGDRELPWCHLFLSSEDSDLNNLSLYDSSRKEGEKLLIDLEPGAVLMPEQLDHLEKILIMAPKALLSAVR